MKTNHVGRRRVCAELLQQMESPQEMRITAENLKRKYSSTLKGGNLKMHAHCLNAVEK